jgi:hypothetical protein
MVHRGWVLFMVGILLKILSIYFGGYHTSFYARILVERTLMIVGFFGDILSIVGFLFALLDPRLRTMEKTLIEIRNILREAFVKG